MVREEHAERIRRWHENAYQVTKSEAGEGQRFDYLGVTLVVPPEVMPITVRWFAPRDLLEAATTDENYRAMTAFFTGVGLHLAPAGRMMISFGTSGDLAYLKHLIDSAGFSASVVARRGLAKDGWQVDYFAYLLTKSATV